LTLGLAAVLLVLHGSAAAVPGRALEAITAFPRNKWAGRILASIAFLWAAWLVYNMPLGRFEYLKKWLFIVTPGVIGMSFVYMKDLLAPRALGGLLLLYPAPVLAAARLHDSSLSVVMSVVSYIMVIKGMALVLNPWFFRKATARILTTDARCRMLGSMGVVFDLILLGLALFIY